MPNSETLHYFNLAGMLSDSELNRVWEIVSNALDRKGWVGQSDDAELSIRLYDDNLKQNIDSSTEYDPEPFEIDHPYYYEH